MNAELQKAVKRTVQDRIRDMQVEWHVDPNVIAIIENNVRHTIKLALSLSCLTGSYANKHPRDSFLRQIPENIWLSIILSLRGHLNAANVTLRQSVELFYKHLYFLHHPVEYGWIQKDENIREFSFTMLTEYVGRIDAFDDFSGKEYCLNSLSSVFADCSRYVHVHSEKFFSGETVRLTAQDSAESFKKTYSSICKIVPAISVLSTIYQYELFDQLSSREQDIVNMSLPPDLKKGFIAWRRRRSLSVD